jgi:hypothetical protein
VKNLHNQYKECVAENIQKAFQDDKVVDGEVCLNEKAAFYTYLHEQRRYEHDNLVAYFKTVSGSLE